METVSWDKHIRRRGQVFPFAITGFRELHYSWVGKKERPDPGCGGKGPGAAPGRFLPAPWPFLPAPGLLLPASRSFLSASGGFLPAPEFFPPASGEFFPASGMVYPARERFFRLPEEIGPRRRGFGGLYRSIGRGPVPPIFDNDDFPAPGRFFVKVSENYPISPDISRKSRSSSAQHPYKWDKRRRRSRRRG